jgi:hypothetical protein
MIHDSDNMSKSFITLSGSCAKLNTFPFNACWHVFPLLFKYLNLINMVQKQSCAIKLLLLLSILVMSWVWFQSIIHQLTQFGISLLSKQLWQDLHIEISIDKIPSFANPYNFGCICFVLFNNYSRMFSISFCQWCFRLNLNRVFIFFRFVFRLVILYIWNSCLYFFSLQVQQQPNSKVEFLRKSLNLLKFHILLLVFICGKKMFGVCIWNLSFF